MTSQSDHSPPTSTADPASVELAQEAVSAILDKQGSDVTALDVGELLRITEVFVIATGTSRRQVLTLAEVVRERLRDTMGLRPLRVEGEEEGEWVLLDFGSIVVHLFQPDLRAFYDLERLWADAPRLALQGVA